MTLTRRAVLRFLALLPAPLAANASAGSLDASVPGPAGNAAVTAIVDAIVPADALDPGAVDAGIDGQLIDHLRANASLRELYERVLPVLFAQARVADGAQFAALPLPRRVSALHSLSDVDTPPGRVGRMVYDHARRFVMERYYASPDGQAAVGYRPPSGGYPLSG